VLHLCCIFATSNKDNQINQISIMKKFIVIIQTSSFNFKALVLKAMNKEELFPMYRNMGVTYSIQPYSQHNMNMAKFDVGQLNTLRK
jgi:hypothetical protein